MNMTNEKGITILSLVVTMIVMIILAGVTISIIGNDKGSTNEIISQVQNHVSNQSQMIDKENDKMNQTLKNQEEDWGIT